MSPGIAGLLLAAGAGRRYGGPKALAPAPDDPSELLVQRGVRTLRDGGCDPIVVVLGAGADDVPALPGAVLVRNDAWQSGLGSSLRAGLAALPDLAEAVVVLLVDTPGIGPAAVQRISAGASAQSLRAATYHGEAGHPVLLGRDHWAGAAALAIGDRGARAYLTSHGAQSVPCDDIADGTDLDVPESEVRHA